MNKENTTSQKPKDYVEVATLYVEIRHRLWLKIYLWAFREFLKFYRNYIDMEAMIDEEKAARIIARGSYVVEVDKSHD